MKLMPYGQLVPLGERGHRQEMLDIVAIPSSRGYTAARGVELSNVAHVLQQRQLRPHRRRADDQSGVEKNGARAHRSAAGHVYFDQGGQDSTLSFTQAHMYTFNRELALPDREC